MGKITSLWEEIFYSKVEKLKEKNTAPLHRRYFKAEFQGTTRFHKERHVLGPSTAITNCLHSKCISKSCTKTKGHVGVDGTEEKNDGKFNLRADFCRVYLLLLWPAQGKSYKQRNKLHKTWGHIMQPSF